MYVYVVCVVLFVVLSEGGGRLPKRKLLSLAKGVIGDRGMGLRGADDCTWLSLILLLVVTNPNEDDDEVEVATTAPFPSTRCA